MRTANISGLTHLARRLAPLVLSMLTAMPAVCGLPGCTSKLPTPIISGPDSGYVRAPVRFRDFGPDGKYSGMQGVWAWGDGESSSGDVHAYAGPGTYSVAFQAVIVGVGMGRTRTSDWSAPCTINIVADNLAFPDTLVDTIQTGNNGSVWACLAPDGSRLYVTRAAANMMSVIETQTNSIVADVPVQDSPVRCVASGSGDRVYVLNAGSGTVSVVRTSDYTVTDTIEVDSAPNCLAVLPDDSLLYVGYADTGLVEAYHPASESLIAGIVLPGIPSGMAVRPGGEYILVTSETAKCVSSIRTSDNTLSSSATLSGGPSDCTFSQGGETAYVPCPSSKEIVLLRATDLTTMDVVNYDSMRLREVHRVSELPGGPCLYGVSPTQDTRYHDANYVVVIRQSDNYVLRILRWEHSGLAGPPAPMPDGSQVYVPTSKGVYVIGLRPGR